MKGVKGRKEWKKSRGGEGKVKRKSGDAGEKRLILNIGKRAGKKFTN